MSTIQQQIVAQRAAKRIARSRENEQKGNKLKEQGNEMFKKGDWSGAADYYEEAMRVHGRKAVYLSNLCAAYINMKRFDEAESLATEALLLDPKHVKARWRRAMARKELRLFKAAILDLEGILNVEPNNTPAAEQLETLFEMMARGEGEETGDSTSDDEYPAFDEEKWEIDSVSDSSDCQHTGNGVTCSFYNHGGCNRGDACAFSHAPDEKSVRDNLGKNVCIFYLLDTCKFGDYKCIYSHSKEHLPQDGWWDNPEALQLARDVKGSVEERRFGGWNEGETPGPKSRRSRGKKAEKGRSKAKKAQQGETFIVEPKEDKLPALLLLSLENQDFFDQIHAHLLTALRSRYRISQAMTSKSALESLRSGDLAAVFVTDSGITKRHSTAVLSELVNFAREGGVVVVGGLFNSFTNGSTMEAFFRDAWGVPWKMGSYYRTTFSLNPLRIDRFRNNAVLTASYSMKCVHLKDVSPEQMVYVAQEGATLESRVFAPEPITNRSESPVVFTSIGNGYLGFIGDVNAEEESTGAMLGMLGVSA